MGLVGGQAKGFVSDAMMATTCTMKTGPMQGAENVRSLFRHVSVESSTVSDSSGT